MRNVQQRASGGKWLGNYTMNRLLLTISLLVIVPLAIVGQLIVVGRTLWQHATDTREKHVQS